jgi:hypothetical protein
LLLQLTLLSILAGLVLALKGIALWRQLQEQEGEAPMNTSIAVPLPLCLDVLPGAGSALAHPPSDLGQTIDYLRTRYAHRRYTIPLGWERAEQGTPVCVVAHLVDDVYHCLLTAKSRVGKDNAAILWLLTLALQNPPTRLQVAILDGKDCAQPGPLLPGWASRAPPVGAARQATA